MSIKCTQMEVKYGRDSKSIISKNDTIIRSASILVEVNGETCRDSVKIDLSADDQSDDKNIQHSAQYDEKSETSIREDENEISRKTIAGYGQEAPISGRIGPQSINRHHNDQYNWRATGLTMTSAVIVIVLFGIVLLVAFSVVNVLMDDPVPILDEW
uniref:Uncharacterized protein n=1 Tax=Romanomermis culicivorax TaxID=13658 RepID=A0A915K0L7_ROMCU